MNADWKRYYSITYMAVFSLTRRSHSEKITTSAAGRITYKCFLRVWIFQTISLICVRVIFISENKNQGSNDQNKNQMIFRFVCSIPSSILTLSTPWGKGQKRSSVGSVPKTFWLLVCTLLPDQCKSSSLCLVPVPYYWNWTKTAPLKKRSFW